MTDRAIAAAVDAARAAGEIAMRYYTSGFDVSIKDDQSPVTQADREAEKAIVEILSRAFPSHGILGEELGARGDAEVRWIVDPIDGTRNFVRHVPIWATLIALEERGEITAGVIHVPPTGEMYTARRGRGAFLNGERLDVSTCAVMGEAFLVHGGLGLIKHAGRWDGFMRLVDATERQRGFGDYMGYTVVAGGKGEIYLEVDLKPWDLAACKILVEEAGGVFTDLDGRATIYSGHALASNGRLHEAALALLRG
jgi:histidinol-phosphatase